MPTKIVLFAMVILFGIPSLPGLDGLQLVPPAWAWEREPNKERNLEREQLEPALRLPENPCMSVGTSGQDKGKQGQDKKAGQDQQKKIEEEVAKLKKLGAKDKDIKVSEPDKETGTRTVEAEWTKDGKTHQTKKTFDKDGLVTDAQEIEVDANGNGTAWVWQFIYVEGFHCGGFRLTYGMKDGTPSEKPTKVEFYDPKDKKWKDAPKAK